MIRNGVAWLPSAARETGKARVKVSMRRERVTERWMIYNISPHLEEKIGLQH